MQPKRFSEYLPIPAEQADGTELIPIVKGGINTSILSGELPVSEPTQTELNRKADSIDLGTAAGAEIEDFATAAQGAKADTAVQPSGIADFETTTELNNRDTANRSRASHTGSQAIGTVTGLQGALDGKRSALNVTALGAVGDGTTDDTTAINAALALAFSGDVKHVYAEDGIYLISSPLRMYGGTTLELAPGATIKLASGSDCNMITNVGYTANRSVSDAVTTASSTTVTSATATFTSADIGSSIAVPGAGGGGQLLVTTITAVGSSSTVTVALAASVSVSGASLSVYRHDSDIELCGGTWDRQNNSGTNNDLHSLLFRHVDNIHIHDTYIKSTAGKYAIGIGDVDGYTVERIKFNTHSDGLHLTGPALRGSVDRLYGTTGDDMLSFTAADYATYADTAGLIDMCYATNITGKNALCLLKIIGGTGIQANNITVKGLYGTTTSSCVRIINDGTGGTDSTGIVVENINCKPPSSTYPTIVLSASNLKEVTLRDITSAAAYSGAEIIEISGTALITQLVVDGIRAVAGSSIKMINFISGTVKSAMISRVSNYNSAVSGDMIYVTSGATVQSLTIDKVGLRRASAGDSLLRVAGTLNYARLSNVALLDGGRVLRTDSTAVGTPNIQMDSLTLDNGWDIAQVDSALDLTIVNAVIDNTRSWLISCTNAASDLTVRGAGFAVTGAGTGFSLSGGGNAPRVINPDFPVDIADIENNADDMAINTNASSGALGRVIADGSTWMSMYPADPTASIQLAGGNSFAIDMATPGIATLSTNTSGGGLSANTYYYKIVATDGTGFTLPGPESSITTTGATSLNTVSWSSVPGATGYRVYRGTASNAQNVYIVTTLTTINDPGGAPNLGSVPTAGTAFVNNISGGVVSGSGFKYPSGTTGYVPTSDSTGLVTLQPVPSSTAPDATTLIKGIVQLANDLGGTADLPTTPTAVHKAGTETITGEKTFSMSNTTGITVASVNTSVRAITVNNTGAQTAQDALVRMKQSSASTTVPVMELETDATTGGALLLDNNGNGITLNIDHDGNSASAIIGQKIDVANAGAGGAYGTIVTPASVLNGFGTATPHSTLHSAGSFATAISTKTANYTATTTDHTILCDATSGAITITLPAVSTISGRLYVIKKTDVSANTITIDGNSAETIDGATTLVLTTQWEAKTIQSNGTAWFVV